MRKLIFLVLCAVIAAFSMATFSSCGDNAVKPWSKTAIEEIATESANGVYYDLINPTFLSVDDAVSYHDQLTHGLSIDSVFMSIPKKTLRNVANVCIKNSGSANKQQIVDEYITNAKVYKNLPDQPATDSGGSDVTKEEKKLSGVFSTEYNYYTDTVNGKPVKVQVKTEKSYAD